MSGERMTAGNVTDEQSIDTVDQQYVPVDPAEIDEVMHTPHVVARPFNPDDTAATFDSDGNKIFKNVQVKKTTGGYL